MHKILYVDDQSVWAAAVATFLKLSGYPVVVAANGKQALAEAEAGTLGAMILDVDLGPEDPVEILKGVKAKNPQAQVVLYTGLAPENETVQKLLKAGAGRHLRKGHLRELLCCLQEISKKPGLIDQGPRLAPKGAWLMM